MDFDNSCRFATGCGGCKILITEKCDGYNKQCKFSKTEKQFRRALNRAILINRRKGNCANCKYKTQRC